MPDLLKSSCLPPSMLGVSRSHEDSFPGVDLSSSSSSHAVLDGVSFT